MTFSGRLALVTGAGSGMGQLAARNMATAGATVVALDLNAEGLEDTKAGQSSIRTYQVDVTDAGAVASIVADVERDLGPVDRLMTAAGIMPTGTIMDMDTGLIHKTMAVNYGGTVNVVKAALPAMLERGRGEVVTFASMSGLLPGLLFGAYNASKFAVVAFTEVLYQENRESGVRFGCVCPPLVRTPLLAREKENVGQLRSREPLEPQQVLDAIERGLDRGTLLIFADRLSRVGWWMRRVLPGVVWRVNHKEEGW